MQRLIIIFLLILPLSVSANSISDKLKHIAKQIIHTKHQLEKKQTASARLQKRLKNTEINISNTHNQLTKTNKKIKKTQADIEKLHKGLRKLNTNLALQLMVYTEQLQASYMITPQSRIKLLLNQQDPNQVDRYLTYANYLNHYQKEILNKLRDTQTKLLTTKNQLANKDSLLHHQQKHLEEQEITLRQEHQQRQIVLSELDKQINSKQQKLDQLSNNKMNLEKTLAKLQKSKYTAKYFKEHRGHLVWPTKGKVITEFGTPIEQSQMHWNGVIITAKDKNPVKAVAPGKVVFSDWMPGFGLVLIIDHGNGYMTIYGRNSTLYKAVGNYVAAGETVAQVGKSGGFKKPTLYFSVRHNTKALDPRAWCINYG